MAFDTPTRNRLLKTVNACRKLLTEDFDEQLRSRFGIYAKEGSVREIDQLTSLSDVERETARLLRERIQHIARGKEADETSEAVGRILREQAFTIMNRFAAIRMAEERSIISQSVGDGLQSKGFRVFEQAAGAALGTQYERYLVYLDCLFDELSLDLGVLFDRSDALGLLFPTENAVRELFEELNHSDISALWAEDETIGWIYQYWNSKEERKAMRDASAAPRNSRELAVRNQFFTPRYVVEFLTDNTLGRIWYEMTKGKTRLAEQCRYLVRRPTEIFLGESAEAPDTPEGETEETLSQEELLKQPVHIPHRPVKDPREIRLLDPACGSMHFGLYAFDLFEVIYEESWDNGLCPALQEAYGKKEDYLRDVPRLIIEHNIHGVDIDPRAVQIAGLSLWLRAQKTWKDTPAAKRPRVRRSNIVCAEPMPGSDAMLEDFVQTLDPPLLGEFVKTVFDKMQLAGEAGTLLKIEEEIRTAIDDARQAWEKLQRQSPELFSTDELNKISNQPELSGMESSLLALRSLGKGGSGDFFDNAEERIYEALEKYAESAEAGDYQRRLFAEDAAHGFAFIDLCRKRYDAVVMNPPFGEVVKSKKGWLAPEYKELTSDLYCYFVARAFVLIESAGLVGAITSASYKTYVDYLSYRDLISKPGYIAAFCDLGWGVLDQAYVEACCYILDRRGDSSTISPYFDLREEDDKQSRLSDLIESQKCVTAYWKSSSAFAALESSPIIYWWPKSRLDRFASLRKLGQVCEQIGKGAGPHAIFYRARWEVPHVELGLQNRWAPFSNGGTYSPFFRESPLVLEWKNSGDLVKAYIGVKYPYLKGNTEWNIQLEGFYGRPGLTYGKKTTNFSAQYLFPGEIFSFEGMGIFLSDDADRDWILSYLNSSFTNWFLNTTCGLHKNPPYLRKLPIPEFSPEEQSALATIAQNGFSAQNCGSQFDETSAFFLKYRNTDDSPDQSTNELIREIDFIVNTNLDISKDDLRSSDGSNEDSGEGENANSEGEPEDADLTTPLVSYVIGNTLGRWDIRYATGERQAPELPDPFDPLPVCPPGMLQNADGLPAAPADVPDDYPLRITWPGILVDDDGHPEDIVTRVRDALAVICGEKADGIEAEACEILKVKAKPKENLDALRVYFRDPNKFFKDHLARYSKSRRKAPIYWPLSTESGSYTLWIYYHRLDSQTLFTCVEMVELKREEVGRDIESLRARIGTEGSSEEREKLEDLIKFQSELKSFHNLLLEVTKLPYRPDLNDGVQITAAPLWQLFRHKPWQALLNKTWGELQKGKYDWAHLAMTIWPDRVVPLCAKDRSLAIAHGIEDLLWVSGLNSKQKEVSRPLKNPEDEIIILKKTWIGDDEIQHASSDYEYAKTKGMHSSLWFAHPEEKPRRRLSPNLEISAEITRRKGQ